MRISDWSSDVCSSDLQGPALLYRDLLPNAVAISAFTDHMIEPGRGRGIWVKGLVIRPDVSRKEQARRPGCQFYRGGTEYVCRVPKPEPVCPERVSPDNVRASADVLLVRPPHQRTEEPTPDLPSLMRY